MDVEMDVLMRNGTWDKCILPQGKKPIGCRWILTIKYKPDGTVERYKARLVAKGYTQTYGIDYSETFSPVAKIDTIRVLFSIAANQSWPLHQFDVKNAFQHRELKEEVYMEAPSGFSQHFKQGEIYKLKKYLYGLKQSPRAWFGRFTLAMKKYGYKQKFKMKDLGNLRYFLRIEVMRSPQGIFICQKKYILDLLAETGMIDCKPADTSMIINQKLFMKTKAKLANRDRYLPMLTGLETKETEDQLLDISPWLEVIWSHGKVKSKKVVSLSNAEAEFRGIAKGLAEALRIRKCVSAIGFPPKESIRIMSDNKAAIQISENPMQHDRTKHVEVDRHFIKEKLEAGIIKLPFVKSKYQLEEILKKAVGMVILHKCLNKLNFGNPTIQLEGEC
nr:putative RNA-directed DNA polymerase [Tanacetum cinerariifolium]